MGSQMSSAKGVREVGWFDCAGGGQIVVEKGIAYIGHMASPFGTSIVDVRDPKNPKGLAELKIPAGTHSHKVRVSNGIMVVNHEVMGEPPSGWRGGFGVHDVSNPSQPREIARWETAGTGMHRYDFDGRYLYGSPTFEGYRGNIVGIFDLQDPTRPQEVGRWWMPGQWIAGGETPTWEGTNHRCHHPLRMGDRPLYRSGRAVSSSSTSPIYRSPSSYRASTGARHSHVQPIVRCRCRSRSTAASCWWSPTRTSSTCFRGRPPSSGSSTSPTKSVQCRLRPSRSTRSDGTPQPKATGCHQPIEKITGTEIPAAWFAHGMRIIDIAVPRAPREVAYFVPDPAPGQKRPSSNDVFVDDRGLIYLIDRVRGFHILERV